MVATPHCFEGNPSVTEILERWRQLDGELKRREIPLQVLPGAELLIEPRLPERARQGQVLPLNRGRYLLLELPLFQEVPPYLEELLFELKACGYAPILAHPERVKTFQRDLSLLSRLVSGGLYTQLTKSSLTGLQGSTVQRTAGRMLDRRLVHLLGTDAHSGGGRLLETGPALKLLTKKIGAAGVEAMLKTRPEQLLHGQELEIPTVLTEKSRWQLLKKKLFSNRRQGMSHGRGTRFT